MRPFQQVDVFSTAAAAGQPGGRGPRRGRPEHRADGALHALDQPVRGDLPAAARRTQPPTTPCASSRRSASCPSPGTRRWAAVTPGSRPVAGHAIPSASCRSAPPGLIPIRRIDDVLAFAAPPTRRSGPVDGCGPGPHRAGARHRPRGHRRQPVGGQRPRVGGGHARVSGGRAGAAADQATVSTSTSASWACIPRARSAPTRCARSSPTTVGEVMEDPVTGSLNASLAQWLVSTGRGDAAVRRRPGHGHGPRRTRAHQPGRRWCHLGRWCHAHHRRAARSTSSRLRRRRER